MPKNLCLIPAKQHSSRLPYKNFLSFLGKPIIKYPIEEAGKSLLFEGPTYITSDHDGIAYQYNSNEFPCHGLIHNPDQLSSMTDLALLSIEQIEARVGKFEYLCLIFPTSVFTTSEHLIKSRPEKGNVFCAKKFDHPIERGFKEIDGEWKLVQPEHEFTRTQDLSTTIHDTGQFYWIEVESFKKNKSIFHGAKPYIMKSNEVQDIDTPDDWTLAELKYRVLTEASA